MTQTHKAVHPEELDSWLRSSVTQTYLATIRAYIEHLHEDRDNTINGLGRLPNEETMSNLFQNKGAAMAATFVGNPSALLGHYEMLKSQDEDIIWARANLTNHLHTFVLSLH